MFKRGKTPYGMVYFGVFLSVRRVKLVSWSNDPHKKESAQGNVQWKVNFFSLLQLVISLAKTQRPLKS